ncbi:hypothetical protein A464_1729 [Salmonella bongori N268-08]|uniref:Uncharacterized protein n=1 Tax=Salmonella bongori N268-08 TaxID=1197719 RepID=S5MWD9_SALBN|nr:hypothetical protein A464_1729 [Salmonella bongori N268-08]
MDFYEFDSNLIGFLPLIIFGRHFRINIRQQFRYSCDYTVSIAFYQVS